MANLFLVLFAIGLFGSSLAVDSFPHQEYVISEVTDEAFGSVVVRHLSTNDVVVTWSETNGGYYRILGKLVRSDSVVSFEVTTDTNTSVTGQFHTTCPHPDGFLVFFVSDSTSFLRSYDNLGNPTSNLVNVTTHNSCLYPVSSYLSSGNIVYACFMPDINILYLALVSASGAKIAERQRSFSDVSSLHMVSSGQSVALTARLNATHSSYFIFNQELLLLTEGQIRDDASTAPGITSPADNDYSFLGTDGSNNLNGVNVKVDPRLELFQLRSFEWNLTQGGDPWVNRVNWVSRSEVVPQRSETTVWVSSYNLGYRRTVFDLLELGYSAEELDAQPPIVASEWYMGVGTQTTDFFNLRVRLLNASSHIIAEKFTGLITTNVWQQVVLEFNNYGPGVRFVYWEDSGDDVEFWSGNYGAAMDAPSARIKLPPSVSERQPHSLSITPNSMSFVLQANGEGLLYWTNSDSDVTLTKVNLTSEGLVLGYQTTLNTGDSISSLAGSLQTSVEFWGTGGAAVWGEVANGNSVLKLVIYSYECQTNVSDCLCPDGFVFNSDGGCDVEPPLAPPTADPTNPEVPVSNVTPENDSVSSASFSKQLVTLSALMAGLALLL